MVRTRRPMRTIRPARRRGIAVIVVLGLISIAMALSYTMMRSQATTLKIQENTQRRGDAREAAMSGLMAALGQMHQADWTGIGSTLAGRLSPSQTYTVLYTTGDPCLTPSHAEFSDWPWRVTLTVTGFAMGDKGGATSTHGLRAVARFVPKGLATTPPDWPQMRQFTVYQHDAADFVMNIPGRIEGPVWMQGELKQSESYPATSSSRRRYLSDLNVMKNSGRGDYRPFSGPVSWRSIQSTEGVDLLTQALAVPAQTVGQKTAANWNHPGAPKSYQLYPGGEEYAIPRLGQTLQDISLAPDPQKNPLGVVMREGSLEVRGNVSMVGQLIATDDIFISGTNVKITPPDLPSPLSSGEAVHLPILLAGDDVRVFSGAAAALQGSVLAWDDAEVRPGTETTQFDLRGNVVSKQFMVGPRTEWEYGSSTWSTLYGLFQWTLNSQPLLVFPDFISPLGRKPAPKIILAPDATPHIDHFPQPGQPVYAPGAGDAGLRWELIDFKDLG